MIMATINALRQTKQAKCKQVKTINGNKIQQDESQILISSDHKKKHSKG
jgi:hypothetical protein